MRNKKLLQTCMLLCVAIAYNTISAQTDALYINQSGDIGIGTVSPLHPLSINGVAAMYNSNNLAFYTDAGHTQRGLVGMTGPESDIKLVSGEDKRWLRLGANNGCIAFFPDNTANTSDLPKVIITSSGYLGIGATDPKAPLDVKGNIQISNADIPMGLTTEVGGSSPVLNLDVNFRETNKVNQYRGAGFRIDSRNNSPLFQWNIRAATASAESTPMVLTEQGNLGIGTISPLFRIHIYQQSDSDGLNIQNNKGGSGSCSNIFFSTYSDRTAGINRPGAGISGMDDGSFSAHLTFSTKIPGADPNALKERMRISSNGFVGIGTTEPQAPLHVSGTAGSATNKLSILFFGVGTSGGKLDDNANWPPGAVTAQFDGNVICTFGSFISSKGSPTYSDERFKKVIGESNSAADLARLRQIRVTDYTFTDYKSMGSTVQKKVIAQQVEQVYPAAVGTITAYIPNIYAAAKSVISANEGLRITMFAPHGLVTGDRVKWIDPSGGIQYSTVKAVISVFCFELDTRENVSQAFIYGKEVNDFRTVDYDAISMLNVSATQELARQVDALKTTIATLQVQIQILSARSELHKTP